MSAQQIMKKKNADARNLRKELVVKHGIKLQQADELIKKAALLCANKEVLFKIANSMARHQTSFGSFKQRRISLETVVEQQSEDDEEKHYPAPPPRIDDDDEEEEWC
jgi:hypothetical protein